MAAEFAQRRKSQYLQDVEAGKGTEWVVVMGNEAGDLDSMASALGYAWLGTMIHKSLFVPITQTSRSDLNLRAENSYALSIAGFDDSRRELLCLDDLSESIPFPSNRFALVDHNRLGSRFSNGNPDAKVVAIVDHHDDEGLYKDTANPRTIVVPTGSCSSLITALIEMQCTNDIQIPSQLATLLLSSIVIDTDGLKPGGKAEKTDIQAAAYLLPRSTLATSSSLSTPPKSDSELRPHEIPSLIELTNTLHAKKGSVSHLGTHDLLRRDYKEYSLAPPWDVSSPIQLGLSSVPIGLEPWISGDPQFWSSTEKWMTERNLAAMGILTSFRDEKELNKGKGKHKRELLMVVNVEASKGELVSKLWNGLEGSKELDLKGFKEFGRRVEGGFGPSVKAKAYKQGNNNATRKVTAPLLKAIIEGTSQ